MIDRIKTKWGYSILVVNHLFSLHTCKIAVVTDLIPDILGIETYELEVTSKRGKKSKRLVLNYCTMNYFEHIRMQREITLFLEEVAIKKVRAKHAWGHTPKEEPAVVEPIYHLEELPKNWEMEL